MWCHGIMRRLVDHHSLLKRIGLAVRSRRKALGLSQERLAELADMHRNYVGLVERGEKNLTVEMLFRIAAEWRGPPRESCCVSVGRIWDRLRLSAVARRRI